MTQQAPMTQTPEPKPETETVSKADFLALNGKYGGEKAAWLREKAEYEGQIARFKDMEEQAKKTGKGVTDEERSAFEKSQLDLKEAQRTIARRDAEIATERRGLAIDRLLTSYPLVTRAELEGQANVTESELKSFAIEKHYKLKEAQAEADKKAKPAAPSNRMDTQGGGNPSAPKLDSRQKREAGAKEFFERTKGAREALAGGASRA